MNAIEVIGSSQLFQSATKDAALVANSDCSVLIQGETGTGKEVIARAIHAWSPRRSAPFVAVNCAAIPAGLIESELYGHERGAFTGALNRSMGRFEAANHGTLFLDEIGDLPLELQPKLLRALQERQFERLGSRQPVRVDVRVIAATHQDLRQLMHERRFRADLFYRLSVFPILLPSLRERRDDISELVEHFVKLYAERMSKSVPRVPVSLMLALQDYEWPGNIRELQNFIERSVIKTAGEVMADLTSELNPSTPRPLTLQDAQRAHIVETLRKTNWVVGGNDGAARRLGIPRTTLVAKMSKLGIVRRVAHDMANSDTPAWSAPLSHQS
ncbi:MAG TPA: sigma 54-interacting transcriptional regulator [Bryobacteraceae bacterium]|nr:sigma 54-interacting transcriptional regulator [Bryobacteraceae bacterium]